MENTSAMITAILVIVVVALLYLRYQSQLKRKAEKGEYRIPLSDDIQKTYFDEYEKQEQQQSAASNSSEEKKQA